MIIYGRRSLSLSHIAFPLGRGGRYYRLKYPPLGVFPIFKKLETHFHTKKKIKPPCPFYSSVPNITASFLFHFRDNINKKIANRISVKKKKKRSPSPLLCTQIPLDPQPREQHLAHRSPISCSTVYTLHRPRPGAASSPTVECLLYDVHVSALHIPLVRVSHFFTSFVNVFFD